MSSMSDLSEILRERGYVYQHSSEKLEEITDGPKRTFYYGVDPTADSMHVGQLQGILVLRRFLEDGHKLIVLVGGGTGMIGDPGGKSSERNLLDEQTVEANVAGLNAQFKRLLEGFDFLVVNNADWLKKLKLMVFLRDVGKHFTVNEMVKRDSVRPRLENPDSSISFTEFSYMVLQAYDYLNLHKKYGCDLQIGGSDQWGNMVSGADLIRRATGNKAYALSWPLLVDMATGKKFGKSEQGTIWLDPAKTSPFQFYQFWYNTADNNFEEYFLKMTMLTKTEIDAALHMHKKNPAARHAQEALAYATTALVHGEKTAQDVQGVSAALFSDVELKSLTDEQKELLQRESPSAEVRIGLHMVDALIASTLAASKRQARQLIEEGAITLNGGKISDTGRVLMKEDFQDAPIALLKKGKRGVAVLRI